MEILETMQTLEKNKYIIGVKDLEYLLLNKLSHQDLLTMYSINKSYNNLCNDNYFHYRLLNLYPETIHYKDYVSNEINENNENEINKRTRTWKNHYLNIVKYIDLLKRNYRYIYRAEDKSPELLYLVRQIVPSFYSYNKNIALRWASETGNLALVKYLVENGANIHDEDDFAFLMACGYGHLKTVKYLNEQGANMHVKNGRSLINASRSGHLAVVKYLIRCGLDIHSEDDASLILATLNNHLSVVKYLIDNGCNINAENNLLLIKAIKRDENWLEIFVGKDINIGDFEIIIRKKK